MLGTGLLCTRPAVKKAFLLGIPCYKYAVKGPKEPYSALDPTGVLVERLGSDSPFSEVDLSERNRGRINQVGRFDGLRFLRFRGLGFKSLGSRA